MKKLSCLLLVLCLLFSLTACGTEVPADVGDAGSSLSTTTTAADNVSGDDAASDAGDGSSSSATTTTTTTKKPTTTTKKPAVSLDSIPAYSGKAYVAINNNQPSFSAAELTTRSYESYAALDSLGRCGVTVASVGQDLMPTEERGSIGQVKPSGWHTVKYDNVDGKYLYNRCHLIGFQLTGENANTRNLITGTRYLNIEGMLPFENMVADYVKETGNHVAYRVTPIFSGNNLVASGVQMEGYSVEDNGEGICFNVYCYNVQPGITINYADGSSYANAAAATTTTTKKATTTSTSSTANGDPDNDDTDGQVVYRTPSGKRYHLDPDCGGKNSYQVTYDQAVGAGLTPCQKCAA